MKRKVKRYIKAIDDLGGDEKLHEKLKKYGYNISVNAIRMWKNPKRIGLTGKAMIMIMALLEKEGIEYNSDSFCVKSVHE